MRQDSLSIRQLSPWLSGVTVNVQSVDLGVNPICQCSSAVGACCYVEGALVPYLVDICSRALHYKLAAGLLVVQHLTSLLQHTQPAHSVSQRPGARVDTVAMPGSLRSAAPVPDQHQRTVKALGQQNEAAGTSILTPAHSALPGKYTVVIMPTTCRQAVLI
jgi:hypothetical protein